MSDAFMKLTLPPSIYFNADLKEICGFWFLLCSKYYYSSFKLFKKIEKLKILTIALSLIVLCQKCCFVEVKYEFKLVFYQSLLYSFFIDLKCEYLG